MHKQTLAIVAHRHGHRQFRGRELEGELVFLGDLGVGPARRPVELEHPQRAILVAQLIDAIFVAVERKQPPEGSRPMLSAAAKTAPGCRLSKGAVAESITVTRAH
jgi:hypothetical protein